MVYTSPPTTPAHCPQRHICRAVETAVRASGYERYGDPWALRVTSDEQRGKARGLGGLVSPWQRARKSKQGGAQAQKQEAVSQAGHSSSQCPQGQAWGGGRAVMTPTQSQNPEGTPQSIQPVLLVQQLGKRGPRGQGFEKIIFPPSTGPEGREGWGRKVELACLGSNPSSSNYLLRGPGQLA